MSCPQTVWFFVAPRVCRQWVPQSVKSQLFVFRTQFIFNLVSLSKYKPFTGRYMGSKCLLKGPIYREVLQCLYKSVAVSSQCQSGDQPPASTSTIIGPSSCTYLLSLSVSGCPISVCSALCWSTSSLISMGWPVSSVVQAIRIWLMKLCGWVRAASKPPSPRSTQLRMIAWTYSSL